MPTFTSPGGLLSRPGDKPPSVGVFITRVGVVALPVLLLLAATLYAGSSEQMGRQHLLWLGTAFQILLSSLLFHSPKRWRQPLGSSALILYLIALVWLWLGLRDITDWYLQFAQ